MIVPVFVRVLVLAFALAFDFVGALVLALDLVLALVLVVVLARVLGVTARPRWGSCESTSATTLQPRHRPLADAGGHSR